MLMLLRCSRHGATRARYAATPRLRHAAGAPRYASDAAIAAFAAAASLRCRFRHAMPAALVYALMLPLFQRRWLSPPMLLRHATLSYAATYC